MPTTKSHLRRNGQIMIYFEASENIGDNLYCEETMFRVMLNAAFVQSNVLGETMTPPTSPQNKKLMYVCGLKSVHDMEQIYQMLIYS